MVFNNIRSPHEIARQRRADKLARDVPSTVIDPEEMTEAELRLCDRYKQYLDTALNLKADAG